MPKKKYIPAYKYQRERIILERGNKCESCGAENGKFGKLNKGIVKLQVCHRNQLPADHSLDNVAVWCQYCHSQWDKDYKKAHNLDKGGQ